MMKSVVVVAGLAALLSGCVTAQERAQQMQQEALARFDAQDRQHCIEWGAGPVGSKAYLECREKLQVARFSAPAPAPAPAVVVQNPPANPFPPPPAPVTCIRTGNVTTCN
jgi:hypothetical protein